MAAHSVSGHRDAVLVIEPGAGGRVYERTADGREFPWGRVLGWEPPGRLLCEWLVGDTATELEVRFTAGGDGGTVVEIEHRGWEQFGEAADAACELIARRRAAVHSHLVMAADATVSDPRRGVRGESRRASGDLSD